MSNLPLDEAQNNLPRLIGEVAQSHKPVLITSDYGNAVLLSEED
jgi:PHD/YefM family antitoxin component YafN of YafNO toxin-antitoxin module